MIEVKGFDVSLQPLLAALSPEMIQELLENIAESARNHWIGLAGNEFFTTRRDYINGIQEVEIQPGLAVIRLVGVLPNLLENGMDARDLHDTLLGPNVPIAAPGQRGKHFYIKPGTGQVVFYRAIPFRHATPETTGAVGPPMGYAYRNSDSVGDWRKLGQEVYGRAKKLKPTGGMPGGPVQYGGRLPAGLAPKLREHHKTDIYAGMIKEQKTYVSATQSQYMTFRMISTGSPGWLRPATPGRHLAAQVSQYVSRFAPMALEAYVSGL